MRRLAAMFAATLGLCACHREQAAEPVDFRPAAQSPVQPPPPRRPPPQHFDAQARDETVRPFIPANAMGDDAFRRMVNSQPPPPPLPLNPQ